MASNGIEIGTAYVRIEPSARGIGNKISDILNNETGGIGENTGSKLASAIGRGLKISGAAIVTGITAATGAVSKFGSDAVSSYATYEQLVGGVSKLYGTAGASLREYANSIGVTTEDAAESYSKLIEAENLLKKNADEAYKTSGMSANQYMETATSFSAALIGSLGGDTLKAAELTDTAMRSISDNVNTFGSDMGSVTNAFQGFAKQNYTMLDNLKLGYGGTKSEMERLIEDANEYRKSIGETSDLSIESFADIVQAVQSVQEAQHIAGTTNKEAMTTIEGSAASVKAAWENVITAIGRGEGLSAAFDGLLSSIFGEKEGTGLISQIIPRIQTVMEGIGSFVATASPIIATRLPELINGILPDILTAGMTLIEGLGQGILTALPTLMPVAVNVVMGLVTTFVQNLPMIIDTGIDIIFALIDGITDALPGLIPAAVEAVLTIANKLLEPDMMSKIIDAGIKLIVGLTQGLINAIPKIIEAAPKLITSLIVGLVSAFPKILVAGVDMVSKIVQGIKNAWPNIKEAGKNIVEGFKQGIIEKWQQFIEWITDKFLGIVKTIKNIFGIHSPSKVFAQIGDYCVEGFDKSFDSFGENAVSEVESTMNDIARIPAPMLDMEMNANMQAQRFRAAGNSGIVNVGGIKIEITQRDGQDSKELADLAARRIDQEMYRIGAVFA